MEFSGLEAQVFIGVAVILGCAFVALLCDYLKGVNERLRERALELTVRVEESDRWSQLVQAQMQTHVPAASAPVAAAPSAEPALLNEITRLHQEIEQMARSVASLAELKAATAPAVPLTVAEPAPAVVVPEHTHDALPIAAMAMVHQAPAVAEAPAVTELPPPPPLKVAITSDPFATHSAFTDNQSEAFKPALEPHPVSEPFSSISMKLKLPPREPVHETQPFVERISIPSGPQVEVFHDSVDAAEPSRPAAMKIRVMRTEAPSLPVPPVDPLPVYEPPVPEQPVAEVPVPEVSAMEPEAPVAEPEMPVAEPAPAFNIPMPGALELTLPSGMHERATLDFLRNDPAPFTGLVVAIGINDYERLEATAGAEAAQDLVRSVAQLVKSLTSNLVGPQHFACRSSADEFILAFNGEIGPAAQRRMSSVSERLWDFQLRSIGTFSVVFSWGATEANEEPFAEAIDAACERMRETRQNRKSMGGERPRKRVVA